MTIRPLAAAAAVAAVAALAGAGGALALAGGFTDIADNHPRADEIARAVEEGWVYGYDDGTFRPDQRITPAR